LTDVAPLGSRPLAIGDCPNSAPVIPAIAGHIVNDCPAVLGDIPGVLRLLLILGDIPGVPLPLLILGDIPGVPLPLLVFGDTQVLREPRASADILGDIHSRCARLKTDRVFGQPQIQFPNTFFKVSRLTTVHNSTHHWQPTWD
jgi:hypothetical protein